LWAGWLLVLLVVFSVTAINTYYLGALSLPIAALLGIGAKLAWDSREVPIVRLVVLGMVVGTACFGFWLLPSSGTGVPSWLAPCVLALASVLVVLFVLAMRMRHHAVTNHAVTNHAVTNHAVTIAIAIVTSLSLLLVPAVASAAVVYKSLGVFDTPFQPVAVTSFNRAFFGAPLKALSTVPVLERARNGAPDLFAAQTSVLAAPFIYGTGQEVLPIGGYSGYIPEPSVSSLRSMVSAGRFHLVLLARIAGPQIDWVVDHCIRLPKPSPPPGIIVRLSAYYCTPNS
jgi:hypothetical protein